MPTLLWCASVSAGWTSSQGGPLSYAVQYHADQDLEQLRRFWGRELWIEQRQVRPQRKSNSGQLNGRTWRSVHGVLTVTANDTLLRARLQAWMDAIRSAWAVDS